MQISPEPCISEKWSIVCKPAFRKATASWSAKLKHSGQWSSGIRMIPGTFPFRDCIALNCSFVRWRPLMYSSNDIIFDCCAELMPSSNTNSDRLQTVSAMTPHITNCIATRCMLGGYSADSQTIPKPMAIVESMSPANKYEWTTNTIWSEANVVNILSHIWPALMGFGIWIWATIKLAQAVWRQK